MKVYTYKNCDTCKKAMKWLKEQDIEFEELPIRTQPPSYAELGEMLAYYGDEHRKLFNTSGMDYRKLDLKTKLPKMTASEALELLSKNGNLVKRPFLLGDGFGLVGFKAAEWEAKVL